jgi:hypothetical protein
VSGATAVAVLAATALLPSATACGGEEEKPARTTERPAAGSGSGSGSEAGSQGGDTSARTDPNAPLVNATRGYIEALNAGDGRRVCSLLAPGALRAVDLPRRRSSCAASVRASAGYADPRGFPEWERTRIERIGSVARDGARGRVTLTVRHRFADRETISSEEDVVHLVRRDERWRVAKPSATFYRAIGAPDVPPSVLAAP